MDFDFTARFMCCHLLSCLRASVEGAANATVMAGQPVTTTFAFIEPTISPWRERTIRKLGGFRAELLPACERYARAVFPNAAAAAGTAALAAWVVGVAGAFGAAANYTLFVSGLTLLLASRVFARP